MDCFFIQKNISESICLIEKSCSIAELNIICTNLVSKIGFTDFQFSHKYSPLPSSDFILYVDSHMNFSVENRKKINSMFLESAYKYGVNSCSPVVWSQLKNIFDIDLKPIKSKFFMDGISCVTCMLNGEVGIFSLTIKCMESDILIRNIYPYMNLLTSIIGMSIYRLSISDGDVEIPSSRILTKREVSCLQYVANGKTSDGIAKILYLSTRTVNHHLYNAIDKLNVSNRTQAVAKAIALKIIFYEEVKACV